MSKTLIIAVVVIVIAAIAAYMFLGSGPTYPSTTTPAPTQTGGAATGALIDEGSATTATSEAETAASGVAGEIGAVDALEIPDVQ